MEILTAYFMIGYLLSHHLPSDLVSNPFKIENTIDKIFLVLSIYAWPHLFIVVWIMHFTSSDYTVFHVAHIPVNSAEIKKGSVGSPIF